MSSSSSSSSSSVIVHYNVVSNQFINDTIIYEYWNNVLVKKYRTSMRYYGGDVEDFIEISGAKVFFCDFNLELF